MSTAQRVVSRIWKTILYVSLLVTPLRAQAATINAASCSQTAVQAAINSAAGGDTVVIPAGTCVWTQTVNVGTQTGWSPATFDTKAITIQGAGMDQTIIVDNVTKDKQDWPDLISPQVLIIYTKTGGLSRLTGLTIYGGTGIADPYNKPIVVLGGPGTFWRIDHIHFRTTRAPAMAIYSSGGVIDHSLFDLTNWKFGIYGYNGGDFYGDTAWTGTSPVGTSQPFFVEDNTFNASSIIAALDGWTGMRVVFRYNTLVNATIGNHGSESPGRNRSGRSMEIYNNKITITDPSYYYYAMGFRGGTGVVFNNSVTGNLPGNIIVAEYRDLFPFQPWGYCDGTGPFDGNDGVTYETGMHTGPQSVAVAEQLVLTDSTKNWTPNQWVGYSVLNVTKSAQSATISANTANTVTMRVTSSSWGLPDLIWNTGDSYKILRATVCLDQVGRGAGDLISGDTPTPQTWPHQTSEPVYAWSNTLNGSSANTGIVSNSPHVQEGRDFFNNTPRPGYTPYTYPHPLTLAGGGDTTPPSSPSNLRIR